MKCFLFQGKITTTDKLFSVEVCDVDRESAIAQVETEYPDFKWWVSKELKKG